jgi:hypothetical protein
VFTFAGGVRVWAGAQATWLSLLGSLALVTALYGRATSFAFFFDDTFDLTRTEGRSYWSLLSSSEGYSYYRPIPFLIWKALHDVQGHYDQTLLHLLPLAAHALAGWLLYLLLRRLGHGHWSVFPMLLFLTYPFNYQNVPIAGTLFHPLAGAAILASLVLYERARTTASLRARNVFHVTALAATFVALWTHESGIAVAPFIVGLETLLLWRANSRRPSAWAAAHVFAALLFVLTWFTVEKAPFGERTSLDELHPKVLFFVQSFTYPLSAQIVWLDDTLGVGVGILDMAVLALALVGGAWLVAAYRNRRRGSALAASLAFPALAIGLAVAASVPAVARLSWGYVQDSPRLLYLVGIGAAVFWGLLPSLDFRHRWATVAWRVVTCACLLGVIIQSWVFIDVRMTMFERGTAVVDAIVEQGEQFQGRQLLVVNAPSWFAQERYEYLYGHYGVQLMPAYIGLDRVIYTSSARQATTDARSASWNPDVSGGAYPFGPHGGTAPPEDLDRYLREGRVLVDVEPRGDIFQVREVGQLRAGVAERRDDAAGRLGDGVWLSTARFAMTNAGLVVYFEWNVLTPLEADHDAVIELREDTGKVVANYIGYPVAGFSAPRLWQSGDQIEDSLVLQTPAAGHYTLFVGLRQVGTESLAPVYDPSGTQLSDNMLPIGSFTIPSE